MIDKNKNQNKKKKKKLMWSGMLKHIRIEEDL